MFRFAAVLGAAPGKGVDGLGHEAVSAATSTRGLGRRTRARGMRQIVASRDPSEASGGRGTPIEGVLWAAALSTAIWLSIGLVAILVLR